MGSQILSQEGHSVVTVSDGDEAMLYLEGNLPDLVMVDTRMPGPSGFEICKHIKSQPKFGMVKVVLLAGPLEPFDTAEAESAGPDGVLHKPLDAYTLIDTVNSLLGQVLETQDQVEANRPPVVPTLEERPAVQEVSASRSSASASGANTAASTASAIAEAIAAAEAIVDPGANPFTGNTVAGSTVVGNRGAGSAVADNPVVSRTAAAAASKPANHVAALSVDLSDHFASVVEQALGTEDSLEKQRARVEAIVRDVLEAALPAIVKSITERVIHSLEEN